MKFTAVFCFISNKFLLKTYLFFRLDMATVRKMVQFHSMTKTVMDCLSLPYRFCGPWTQQVILEMSLSR